MQHSNLAGTVAVLGGGMVAGQEEFLSGEGNGPAALGREWAGDADIRPHPRPRHWTVRPQFGLCSFLGLEPMISQVQIRGTYSEGSSGLPSQPACSSTV